jgi:hypothetical protein
MAYVRGHKGDAFMAPSCWVLKISPFEGHLRCCPRRSKQRMAMVEQRVPSEWAEPNQVAPHTYPVWVVLVAGLIVLAALYSFLRVPTLVAAGRDLRSGEAAVARHDYTTAVADLERAHEESPSSRKVTIYLATADFGVNQPQAALALIQGMRLTSSEWTTLTQTMPASIQAQFQPTG